MTISGIFLTINVLIPCAIYGLFIYDEQSKVQSMNFVMTWFRRHEEVLSAVFIATAYYSVFAILIWLIE